MAAAAGSAPSPLAAAMALRAAQAARAAAAAERAVKAATAVPAPPGGGAVRAGAPAWPDFALGAHDGPAVARVRSMHEARDRNEASRALYLTRAFHRTRVPAPAPPPPTSE